MRKTNTTMATEKEIRDAYAKIRSTNSTIPDEVLDYMKNAAIEKLERAKDTPAQRAVDSVSNFVNNFSADNKAFIGHMEHSHRALQQSFTKLAFEWLEHVATAGYRTDGRNEASHQMAVEVLDAWRSKHQATDINFGDWYPSQYLPMV